MKENKEITNMKLDISKLQQDVEYIKETLKEILVKLDTKYITREEFGPIKALVFGFAGIVLTAVIGSLVYLVVK